MYFHCYFNKKLNSTHASICRYVCSIAEQAHPLILENKTIFHEKKLTYRRVKMLLYILNNFREQNE